MPVKGIHGKSVDGQCHREEPRILATADGNEANGEISSRIYYIHNCVSCMCVRACIVIWAPNLEVLHGDGQCVD